MLDDILISGNDVLPTNTDFIIMKKKSFFENVQARKIEYPCRATHRYLTDIM